MINTQENKRSAEALLLFAKWFVLLVTYSFLVYKLSTFEHYDALLQYFRHPSLSRYFWLSMVFILVPVNIFIETIKWQKIVEKSERISILQALKAVLAGFATGFATPNRIGEMGGRMMYMLPENKKIAAIYSLLNSFTQNYVIALVGLPAASFYFFTTKNFNYDYHLLFVVAAIFILVFTIILILLPKIIVLFNNHNKLLVFKKISEYKITDLLKINGYSLLRFFVFSVQFFAVLKFFGVELSAFEALISIPTSYLFVTFTPSLAFSEAAIRSSYSVLFIGTFSDNIAGIAFAGFALWVINFVLPMILGSRLIANTK